VVTDSANWKMNDTQAVIHGTVRSALPLNYDVNVGFVVGELATVEKSTAKYDYQQTISEGCSFTATVPVEGNIGYWYRAYVEVDDTVYYGKSHHFGYEMVDLGLPSRTLWCNMNVGASVPEEYGLHFAWGETTTKDVYNSGSYLYGTQNLGENNHIERSDYDVAYQKMGPRWCMPTDSQLSELANTNYCTWTWTTINGVNGFKVTSKSNGRYIFLPAAGFRYDSTLGYQTQGGSYWGAVLGGNNSEYAYSLSFHSSWNSSAGYVLHGNDYAPYWWYGGACYRYYGRTIRPVVAP
jgi:hypothetical protein